MKTRSWTTKLLDPMIGPLFRYLVHKPRRNAKPITRQAPISRLNTEMPWTMNQLRPKVTEIQGSSDVQWSTFDLIFDKYRIEVVLLGKEPDEFRFDSKCADKMWKEHYRNMRATDNNSAQRASHFSDGYVALSYIDLDEFLRRNHRTLEECCLEEVSVNKANLCN